MPRNPAAPLRLPPVAFAPASRRSLRSGRRGLVERVGRRRQTELTPINGDVFSRHGGRRKAFLEYAANTTPVDGVDAPQRCGGGLFAVHDEPRDAVVDKLRNRTAIP